MRAFAPVILFSTALALPAVGVGAQTFNEITPSGAAFTASTNDGNGPANVADNNLATRWSGGGDGAWIQVDLGTIRSVGRVSVAVYQGNGRRNRFDLQVATTSGAWTTVQSGLQSSGTTTLEQNYDFPAVDARWVRYLGHLATLNAGGTSPWNSVTEISIWEPAGPVPTATPTPTPTNTPIPTNTPTPTNTPVPTSTFTPTPTATTGPAYVNLTPGSTATASTSDANVPANAMDGSLATRWSSVGDGHWLSLDLGATRTIGYVRVAVYQGNTRANKFELQLSGDNSTWTTVFNGQSSGTSTALQTFDVAPDQSARYVRYLGHGSTDPTKPTTNSVTELEIWGNTCIDCPTPTPTPTGTPTPTPTPTSDVPTPTPTATPTMPSGECAARFDNGGPKSTWAFFNAGGTLSYKTLDSRGDKMMDFSYAGYGGGGVALPNVPVAETLSPSGGDDTAAIRAALTRTAARPLVDGFRGAVLLRPGTWRVTGALSITTSGVVLRGSGSGTNGTVINVSGTAFRFIEMRGTGTATTSNTVSITDAYVPSGATSFNVSSTAGFNVGDPVFVQRQVTSAWVQFMEMHNLVRDGSPQTWITTSTVFNTDRRIASISGNRVTLDVPLSDSIDASHSSPPGGKLSKYSWPGRISNVGLEGVRILAPPQGDSLSDPKFQFFTMDAVVDAWVKDVYYRDCVDCSSVSRGAKRVTIEDVTVQHTGGVSGAPYPTDWSLNGTQVLAHRFRSLNARNVYTVIAQGSVTGPIVALNYESTQQKGVEPHQRWATGMLFDNINVDGDMSLMNRGYYGSGHGWTVGWAVAWNTVADRYIIQRPQGTMNWSIGGSGAIHDQPRPGRSSPNEPRGTFESHGTRVSPSSLYLAQLCTRLGPQALANIGY
jgi:hypothetical protein